MDLKEMYKYNEDYQKANIKRITVKLNRKVESDQRIIEHLETKSNVQGYIKDLILKDME